MIAPLDLTTEEMEVYKILYSKMDFETNVVKYTLDQIVSDSNSKLLMTKKKVSLIIKNFISENLLSIIEKGSKGNPTVYKIIKISDANEKLKRTLNDTQTELKGNSKETNNASDTNDLDENEKHNGNLKETQTELKGNLKVTPIKDKEKEKKIIYADTVKMTEHEYRKLIEAHGEVKTKRMIEILDNYKVANGKKYASDYRAILNWVVDRVTKEIEDIPKTNNRPNAGAYRIV